MQHDEDRSKPSLYSTIDTDGGACASAVPPSDSLHEFAHDCASHSQSLKARPLSFLREMLDEPGARTTAALQDDAL